MPAMARLPFALVVTALLGSSVASASSYVIPPGREQAVLSLLGSDTLPGGCGVDGASVRQTLVEVTYACSGRTVTVELHHPSEFDPGAAATAPIAVVTHGTLPAGFLEALRARLARGKASQIWVVRIAGDDAPAVEGSPTARPPSGELTIEDQRAYEEGERLYKEHKADEALALFIQVARKRATPSTLGMVVAALASTSPTPERVQQLVDAARAAPADPLAQFLAGVGAHYCGHRSARTREEKARYYRLAIEFLEKARPSYPREPRLLIYLAVSHLRLGDQAEAEKDIDAAVLAGPRDPDAFYCRAEVRQHRAPALAIADMEKYLSLSAELAREGALISPGKEERVRKMRERLIAAAGAPVSEDLFDPLPLPLPPPAAVGQTQVDVPPRRFALYTLATAATAMALILVVASRQRRRGRSAS